MEILSIVEVESVKECNCLLKTGCFEFLNSHTKTVFNVVGPAQKIIYVLGSPYQDGDITAEKLIGWMRSEEQRAFEKKVKECFDIHDENEKEEQK